MKAQSPSQGQGQDHRQWQESAEAEYAGWVKESEKEDNAKFEAWLDTPEGYEWINTKAEAEDEREGCVWWNWDGFNPEDCRNAPLPH